LERVIDLNYEFDWYLIEAAEEFR